MRSTHFWFALALLALTQTPTLAQPCSGDCNNDGSVTINELVRATRIALGVEPSSACPNADRDNNRRIAISELIAAVNSALLGCGSQTAAFVVATDFSSGGFGTIDLSNTRNVTRASPSRRIHEDAVVRVFGDRIYVLNRFFRDTIQILDPNDDFATVIECRVEEGGNPHDIAFVDSNKAFVSHFDSPVIWIVNPSATSCSNFKRGEIDLTSLADDDGNPDMDQMAIVGTRLYVALQKLDIGNILREPAENGAIAVIDIDRETIVDSIELSGENPFSATKGLTLHNDQIVVAQAGIFGIDDGGIEFIDIRTGKPSGFALTERDFGGDVTDFVLIHDQLAYAIVSDRDFASKLVRFDPSNPRSVRTVAERPGFDLFDIELNDHGEIYMADRTRSAPGMRIFDAASGVEKTSQPIDVGLPPFEVVFVR